ncbi:DUF6542 domain-containing protein [Nocardioides antri]|uniref:DUF6542 domain-containing protein n=1 Tax=Nocardioides antri TaxID=2607659 RepID=A0A5B1LZK9_9ACTN|nr:DUF6542 domain-containing protein [Nocardioides antri]KAA1425991.1 hypothetical protein F0U47_16790 [Nocardioides antri]
MTSASRTLWEEGDEPGYQVAALAVALLLTATTVDLLLGARLGLLFDLVFVTVCAAAALRVRPADFFTVGVLPPLAMLVTVTLLAIAEPGSIAHEQDGVVQATVSGLSRHAIALVIGYLLCLGVLAVRNQAQAKRSGSPAPRRSTSG